MSESIRLKDVSLYYGNIRVLEAINLSIPENKITCIIGPSGSGKSTLLRTLNRMNDLIPSFRCTGTVLVENRDIYNDGIDVTFLRRSVGMVFQKPCIFPGSVFDNVLFGLRHGGHLKRAERVQTVEETLRAVQLWQDVKDRLGRPAVELSQGQQQRLAIARALAVSPRILLLDEPTSALDYRSAEAIEGLAVELKDKIALVMVTHKLEQVERVADEVIFVSGGKVRESGSAERIFMGSHKIGARGPFPEGNGRDSGIQIGGWESNEGVFSDG